MSKVEQYVQSRIDALKTDLQVAPTVSKKAVLGGTAFIAGAGSLFAQIGSSPLSAEAAQMPQIKSIERPQAQEGAEVKNEVVGQEQVGVWFHPVTGDQAWPYTFQLRNPGMGRFGQNGKIEEMTIQGNGGTAAVDVRVDPGYTQAIRAQGAKPFVRLHTTPDTTVIVVDIHGQPVRQITADGSGYAGIIGSNDGGTFGIRVITGNEVTAGFGIFSAADLAAPLKTSEADLSQFVPQAAPIVETPVAPQPAAEPVFVTAPAAEPIGEQAPAPEFLPETPVYQFNQAPAETYFLAQSSRGEGWSHGVQFAVPHTPGISYTDKGNVGQMFVLARNGAPTFDLYMKVDPRSINDYKQGAENDPAMWLQTTPNALIQLLDGNRNVLMIRGQDGRDYPAQVQADGAGFAGVVLPDYAAGVNIRVVLTNPELPSDTQIQFGPQRPADQGKASTLVTPNYIPKQ